jgi:hypothetical protein
VKDPEEHHATTAAEDLSAYILTPPRQSSTITFCHGTQDTMLPEPAVRKEIHSPRNRCSSQLFGRARFPSELNRAPFTKSSASRKRVPKSGCLRTAPNPTTHEWNIDFATPNVGTLGTPGIGQFKNGRGDFYDYELINGRSVLVRSSIWKITAGFAFACPFVVILLSSRRDLLQSLCCHPAGICFCPFVVIPQGSASVSLLSSRRDLLQPLSFAFSFVVITPRIPARDEKK